MRKLTLVLLALALVGCASNEQTVDAPVAPSTVPLAAATATTVAPAPETAAAPTAVPTTAAALVPPAQPIVLPPGFSISVFAKGLKDPRMLTVGPDGALYVAERGAGRVVRLPDADGDGQSEAPQVVADNLTKPSSLAFFEDGSLYVAETTRVLRLGAPDASGTFQSADVIIDGLPDGGHSTRTLLFSADWQTLFVAVGSSCNVCREDDARRAAVVAYAPDGTNERIYTAGLRNAVGLAWRPDTAEIWATNNGRDLLGDDQPPETINLISGPDLDFGWPRCHAGRISDPEFGDATACAGVTAPVVEMQAHSAPLGLAFSQGQSTSFPAPYDNGVFVAFHGSWNRSVPTGYKVIFVPLDGATPGAVQDFATGWLTADGSSWGRPVDVQFGSDGALYLSDDFAGIIYRIFVP